MEVQVLFSPPSRMVTETGYNGAVLKTDVAKALWVRILHHPPTCSSIPILAEEMASDTIKYRFESCLEHQFISFV